MAKKLGMDADDDQPQDKQDAPKEHNGPPPKGAIVEYGSVVFNPNCAPCEAAARERKEVLVVRMLMTSADGPIAYYKCPKCGHRLSIGRPWRYKQNEKPQINVAVRPEMQ